MTEPIPPSTRLFFVLGHARSGTTALARLLNASSHLACIYYESNILYRLWQALSRKKVLEEPLEDLLRNFEVSVCHNLIDHARAAGSKKIVFPEYVVADLTGLLREKFLSHSPPQNIFNCISKAFFKHVSHVTQKKIIGDKVPDYLNIPEVITASFPACKLIFLRRDPRAIIHSTLHFYRKQLHLFAVPSAFALAFSFLLKEKGIEKFISGFSAEQTFSINHQDLLDVPQNTALKALGFLQVPGCEGIMFFADSLKKNSRVKKYSLARPLSIH